MAQKKEALKMEKFDQTEGELNFAETGSLAKVLDCEDEGFTDLVRKCLEWDPEKRITPAEALGDRFFES